jgi:hypothetical protein
MAANDEMEVCKEGVVACFKKIFENLSGLKKYMMNLIQNRNSSGRNSDFVPFEYEE